MSGPYGKYGESVGQLTLWVTQEDRALLSLIAKRLSQSRDVAFQYSVRLAAKDLGILPGELADVDVDETDTSTPPRRHRRIDIEPMPAPRPRDAADVLAEVYALILGWPTAEERAAAASGVNISDDNGGAEEGWDTEAGERE